MERQRGKQVNTTEAGSDVKQMTPEELKEIFGEWSIRSSKMGRYMLTLHDDLAIDKVDIYIGKRSLFVRSGPFKYTYPQAAANQYVTLKNLKRVLVYPKDKRILAKGEDSSVVLDLNDGRHPIVHLVTKNSRASVEMMTFANAVGTFVKK